MSADRHGMAGRLEPAIESSRVVGATRRASRGLVVARRGSVFARLTHRLVLAPASALGVRVVALVEGSFLYRWLTAEPEPEVIVIDLRETTTVGPVLALADRLVATVTPTWRHSVCKRMTDGLASLLKMAARSKTAQVLARLQAPPERRDD